MNINPVGGGGWNGGSDYTTRELSPAERAEMVRRREVLREQRAEEARVAETTELVRVFIEAKNDHVHIQQYLASQDAVVNRLQAEAAAAPKSEGFIDSLVTGLLAFLGLSLHERLARALRKQSEMREREERARKRRRSRLIAARNAASRHYDRHWKALDGEPLDSDFVFGSDHPGFWQ